MGKEKEDYTVEGYAAVERKILLFTTTWMEP